MEGRKDSCWNTLRAGIYTPACSEFYEGNFTSCERGQAVFFDFNRARPAFWLRIPNVKNKWTGLLFSLKGGYVVAVVLSDKDFETVNSALLNAQYEFAFLHGLRVTDVPDIRFTWELDCSEVDKLITEAISVLDKFSDNHNVDCS